MNLDDHIRRTAQHVLTRKKMFTTAMSNRVTGELIKIVNAKNSTVLDKHDVTSIAVALVIGNNRRSIYTWLHHEMFNHIILRLRIERKITCPFIINTSRKRKRDIVMYFDENARDLLVEIEYIANYLTRLLDCDGEVIESPEVDVVSAYVAAAIMFSDIWFPQSYKSLLSLTDNVSSTGDYLNLWIDNEPVFYRYFLSSYTTTRLNRAVLFYRSISRERASDDTGTALLALTFSVDEFPSEFKKWLNGVIRKCSGRDASSITGIRSFIKAVRHMALLKSYGLTDGPSAIIPCFLHSVQSRAISSYSYPDFFLKYLIKDFSCGPYTPARTEKRDIYRFQVEAVESAMKQITPIRRRMYTDSDMTSKQRHEESKRIRTILSSFENTVPQHVHLILKCFGEWFDTRFIAGTDIKTLNDYASSVEAFVDTVCAHNMSVTDIDDKNIAEIIDTLRQHYQTKAIKSRVKDFMEFVTSEYGTNLTESIWRKKETRFEDVRTEKPLIGFDLIDKANQQIDTFLAARQLPSGNKFAIDLRKATPSIAHRALNMKQAYSLSIYTGMRRDEVITRRVKDVRFDDGPILVIEEGKTTNAKRVIPLYLLLPDDYLNEFMSFYNSRKDTDGPDAKLFVRLDGSDWDDKEFFEDIQDLFVHLGIPDYSFHSNRGSFASWFLVRWVKVFHRDKISGDEPFLEFELFNDKYDERFKELFWGSCRSDKDPIDFTHALFVLARLLGHGGPVITLERYVHTSDWLYYIFRRHYAKTDISITPQQVAHMLQKPYSTVYRMLKKRNIGRILPADLLRFQQEILT